jgi:hypothetical protein
METFKNSVPDALTTVDDGIASASDLALEEINEKALGYDCREVPLAFPGNQGGEDWHPIHHELPSRDRVVGRVTIARLSAVINQRTERFRATTANRATDISAAH